MGGTKVPLDGKREGCMARKLRKGQKVTFDHHEGENRWSRRKGIVLAVVDGPMTKDGISTRATIGFGHLCIMGIPATEFKDCFKQNIRNLKIA